MKRIRKYYLISITSLQNNLAYATNFFFDIFFYAFLVFVQIQLWQTVFRQNKTLAGYSLQQMLWYCIITELVMLSGSNLFQELNEEIKGGKIAYTLNKPFHYLWYQLANSLGLILPKLCFNIVVGIVLGLSAAGILPGITLGQTFLVGLAIGGGILVNLLILACLGLSAFWLEENSAFFWIYQKLLFILGMFLPIEFFPAWLARFVRYLPFPYVTYAPARLGVAFSVQECVWILGGQLFYGVFFLSLAFLIYRKGVQELNVNGG